ncbi:MAG: AI-2E family transporter [Nanoarchaeota archaeon]
MQSKYNIKTEKIFLLILSVLFIILTIILLRSIFSVIIYSIILSYFLYPLYKKFNQKIKNESICGILTIFSSIFIVFVPLVLLTYFLILNLIKILVEYKEYIENPELLNLVVSDFIGKMTNSTFFTNFDFSGLINMVVSFVLNFSKSFFSSIPMMMAYFVIMLFISYYILMHNKKILKAINDYIPLSIHKQNQILTKIERNVKSLFRGYFLTGLIQTFIAFLGYWVLGAPNLLIITFLTLLTSLIPYIGTPFVWLPVALFMMFTGNEVGGVWLLIYGSLVINLVDNFLRPILMSGKDSAPPAVVFIGFVGGIFAFGISGIILGPLILTITSILLKYLKDAYEY